MDILFQLLTMSTGTRTGVLHCQREEFQQIINTTVTDEQKADCAVLVLMEKKGDEWEFSQAPIFHLDQFLTLFCGASDNG